MVRTGQWSPKPTTRAISNRVYEIWPELSTSSNMVPRIIESLNITQFNPNDHGLRIKILDKIMEKKIYHHQYATKHGNNGAGYSTSTTCDKTIKFAAVAGPIKPPLKKEASIKSVSSTDPINIKASSTEIIKSVLETDPIKIPVIDTYDLVIDGWDINDDTFAVSAGPMNYSIYYGESIISTLSTDSGRDINDDTTALSADPIKRSIKIGALIKPASLIDSKKSEASSAGIIKFVSSKDLINFVPSSTGIIKTISSTDKINNGPSSTGIIKSVLAGDTIKFTSTTDPIYYGLNDCLIIKSVISTGLITFGSSLLRIIKIISIPSEYLKLLGASSKLYGWNNKIESTTDPPGIKSLKLTAQQNGGILMILSKLQCEKLVGIEGIDNNSLSDMTLCRFYNSLALAHIPLQSYFDAIYFDIINGHYQFDEHQIGIIKRNIFKFDDEESVGIKCIDIYSRTGMTLCSCNNLLALAHTPSVSNWITIYFNYKISQFEIYFCYLFYISIT